MEEHVGVGMAEQPQGMGYLYAPEPEFAVGNQLVDVVVVQNKVAAGVFEDIGIVLRLWGYFGRFHFIDYVFRCGSMLEGGVR